MERGPDRLTYTVEEAACLLGIGRTTAYALAKEWRMTNGRSGLPVLELGRVLRVPRRALEGLLDLGTDARHVIQTEGASGTAGGQGSFWDR